MALLVQVLCVGLYLTYNLDALHEHIVGVCGHDEVAVGGAAHLDPHTSLLTDEQLQWVDAGIDGDLRYEFYSYDSDKYMWDNIVKIYSGNVLVAYMNYFTGLDISQEWLISFLNDYLVKI